jgi:hypothetical protein
MRRMHIIALNKLTLLLTDSFDYLNIVIAYTSSTDLLIEERQIHPRYAIIQIHPGLTRGDQYSLQN